MGRLQLSFFALATFAICRSAHALQKGPELLTDYDAGLEIDATDPGFKWSINNRASYETVTDAHTGQKSLKLFNRLKDHGTPRLKLTNTVLLPGKTYFYGVYLKFLNSITGSTHFNVTLKQKIKGINGNYHNSIIAQLKFQRPELGWQRIGADFRMPTVAELEYDWAQFFVHLPAEVDFLFDTNTVYELIQPDPAQWLTDVNADIQQERTNSITITGDIPATYDPTDLEIEVEQVSRPFRFGGCVKADDFNDMTSNFSQSYRDFFYHNYDMATMANAMKWKSMEWVKGVYKTDRVDTFLDSMDDAGIPTRAHTILFGKHKTQPHWLADYTATPIVDKAVLRAEVENWIENICDLYRNRFVQWDVQNEYLHSHFYETYTEDEDFLLDVFDYVAQNCTGDFYLNDYNVVRSSLGTVAMVNAVQWLLDNNKQIDGIGAQTHIRDHQIDGVQIEMVEHRLELLCSLGLPVMITEMTVQHENVSVRADILDRLLRLFYSKPCVKSVVYWTFAEWTNTEPNQGLADGEDVQSNAAGDVWHTLAREEWKTQQTISPSTNQISETFSGHHGDYEVTVSHGGSVIVTSSFTLSKGQDVTHNIEFP